ncbi:MAG: thermonuclease family protein, partial [Clostridia bacterium]|nr:thermonuclease family protein [Clostridia bacterium]
MSPAEYIVTVLLLIAIYFVWTYDKYPNNKVSSEYDGPYEVVKVVDGDTIKLDIDGETTTVRLIGIDTPESVHPDQTKNVPEGKLASEHTKDLLGKSDVFIEYGEEPYDRYGRVLAYVYIDDD